jgi:hypothetical protein
MHIEVSRSSFRDAIDRAAIAALRDAVATTPPIPDARPLRSRWSIEIANRLSRSRSACTEGWQVMPLEPVDGVYIMLRVSRERGG